MNTLILSAFPGCGKTYLYQNQSEYKYSILEIESHSFPKNCGWEKLYVDLVSKNISKYDILLITQQDNMLLELHKRNINFFTAAPDNSEHISLRERMLIKQQWFGRFLLRDNSHIGNMEQWLQKISSNYDLWTDEERLSNFGSKKHFVLKENQYLSDIIDYIYSYL